MFVDERWGRAGAAYVHPRVMTVVDVANHITWRSGRDLAGQTVRVCCTILIIEDGSSTVAVPYMPAIVAPTAGGPARAFEIEFGRSHSNPSKSITPHLGGGLLDPLLGYSLGHQPAAELLYGAVFGSLGLALGEMLAQPVGNVGPHERLVAAEAERWSDLLRVFYDMVGAA